MLNPCYFLFRQVPSSSFLLLNKATPTKQGLANGWFLSPATHATGMPLCIPEGTSLGSAGCAEPPQDPAWALVTVLEAWSNCTAVTGLTCNGKRGMWPQMFLHWRFICRSSPLNLPKVIKWPLWPWNIPKRLRLSASHSLIGELDLLSRHHFILKHMQPISVYYMPCLCLPHTFQVKKDRNIC